MTAEASNEHLKRQQLVVELAGRGGWSAVAEQAIDRGWIRSRSIDVRLDRAARREIAVVEVVDLFDDVAEAWRGFDAKIATVRRDAAARDLAGAPAVTISGLLIVRGTRRNRELVTAFARLFQTHFPGIVERLARGPARLAPADADRARLRLDRRRRHSTDRGAALS